MDGRMSDCFWQSQILLIYPSNFGTANSWETSHPVFDYSWKVNGLCVRPTWRDWKERACHLLLEQKIHKIRIQVPFNGKNMLYIGLDRSKTQAILVIPYYVVNFQVGSHQVYFWKALTLREDCKMASPIDGVRHSVCIPKSNQRKHHRRIPCRLN